MRSCHTFGNRSSLVPAACAASGSSCMHAISATPTAKRARNLSASAAAVAISCKHELVSIAGLERRVSGVGDDAQLRFGPGAVQIPGGGCGAHDIVAALNDGRWDMPDARHIVDQLALAAQEAAIHEVMALDTRHRQRELIFAPFPDVLDVAVQETGGGLPHRPGARGCE